MEEEDETKPASESIQAEGHRKRQQVRLQALRDKERTGR